MRTRNNLVSFDTEIEKKMLLVVFISYGLSDLIGVKYK